ncbi:MAG: hypothetical protein HY619_01605 [Thaumarchaeota archaeon]|nr:hypothetical protein [Nitrososphaerota archaeon]
MEREIARALYYNPDTDTLDIWLGDPSTEDHAEPVTENLVAKRNKHGDTIGFEIITLSRLTNEDIRKMPQEARVLLKQSATRLSIVSHLHK